MHKYFQEAVFQKKWHRKMDAFNIWQTILGGGFKYFYVHPYLRKISHFD